MLWFLKAAYAPAFMFGFIGAGLALVTRGQSLAWLAPLLGAAIAVSFFVERVIPYEPIWNRPRGDSRRDVLHALVNEASVYAGAALIPVLTLLSPAAASGRPPGRSGLSWCLRSSWRTSGSPFAITSATSSNGSGASTPSITQ